MLLCKQPSPQPSRELCKPTLPWNVSVPPVSLQMEPPDDESSTLMKNAETMLCVNLSVQTAPSINEMATQTKTNPPAPIALITSPPLLANTTYTDSSTQLTPTIPTVANASTQMAPTMPHTSATSQMAQHTSQTCPQPSRMRLEPHSPSATSHTMGTVPTTTKQHSTTIKMTPPAPQPTVSQTNPIATSQWTGPMPNVPESPERPPDTPQVPPQSPALQREPLKARKSLLTKHSPPQASTTHGNPPQPGPKPTVMAHEPPLHMTKPQMTDTHPPPLVDNPEQ